MKNSKFFKACFVLAFAFCLSKAFAVDACTETGGHGGKEIKAPDSKVTRSEAPAREAKGTTIVVSRDEAKVGLVGSTGYHYDVWSAGDGNSITYYDDGSFSVEWNGAADVMAGVGYLYDSDKSYKEFEPFSADFEFTKSGSATRSFIGVHVWTQNPMTEFYVVEDQFVKSNWEEMGEKKGEITVDGDTYDIYVRRMIQAVDAPIYDVIYSVRRNYRQSGHVDINAHLEKWEELGFILDGLYEVELMAEAGGGAGYVDYTTARVYEGSGIFKETDSFPAKFALTTRRVPDEGVFRAFDMRGRFLGNIGLSKGVDVNESVRTRFGKTGIFLTKKR